MVVRKILRRGATVVVVAGALAGGAYAVNEYALTDEESAAPVPVRAEVLAPGTFQSAHPYAPYYVFPRKQVRDPSRLSRLQRNRLLTEPASALEQGAMAGSPQIVRLRLRATGDEPATVRAVRFRVVSDASPLRGWFTALPGCMVQDERRAQVNLDAKRPRARYVDAEGERSKALALQVAGSSPQVIELQARTSRHRVAWTAELEVADRDGRTSTVAVDDGGEPFRVTATRSSRGYAPVYGATGVTSFERSGDVRRGGESC